MARSRTRQLLGVTAAVALTLPGCAGEPPLDPGRPRPELRYSEAEMFRLSAEVHADLLARHTPAKPGKQRALLEAVGPRLAKASYLDHYTWRFTLLDDAQRAAAVCLPGGRVLVWSGVFALAKSPSDLAVLLSHALGHAALRHPNERLSGGATGLPPKLEEGAWAATPEGSRAGVLAALGLEPAGEALEVEADEVGLVYLERAGFDPASAAAFWKRVAQADPERVSSLFGHDPRAARRAEHLAKRAREIKGLPPRSGSN